MNYVVRLKTVTIIVRENSNSFDIGAWCSGNTEDFGSSIRGSSPLTPTNTNYRRISILFMFRFVKVFCYVINSSCEVTVYFYIIKIKRATYLHRPVALNTKPKTTKFTF